MRHFKCDLQMNCCFHEWEKTKLEVKLLVRRGISRNMGPKAVWKGSYFRQSSSKRETWGWVRELFFRCIASISTILLSCWWSWSIALGPFFLGQESTWHVSVTGGSSLLATGRWCQSVYGWNWDERTLLMELKRLHEVSHSKYLKGLGMSKCRLGTKRLHEVSHSKYLKGLGMSKCGLGTMTLWSKWTVGPTSSARKVTIRCRAWDLESSVSRELGVFFFAKY